MTTTTTTAATENYNTDDAALRISPEDFATLAESCGWDEAKRAEVWARMEADAAREERLRAKGLKVSYRKALVRMTQVRMYAGRLQDAVCHYEVQTTVSGNTYEVKDALKAAGYRWHPGDRLWYRAIPVGTCVHDNLETTKDLLA